MEFQGWKPDITSAEAEGPGNGELERRGAKGRYNLFLGRPSKPENHRSNSPIRREKIPSVCDTPQQFSCGQVAGSAPKVFSGPSEAGKTEFRGNSSTVRAQSLSDFAAARLWNRIACFESRSNKFRRDTQQFQLNLIAVAYLPANGQNGSYVQ